MDVGNPATGNGILDIGVAWFGDIVHLGHTFGQVSLGAHVHHLGGHQTLFAPDAYVAREQEALAILQTRFGGDSGLEPLEGSWQWWRWAISVV